MALDATELLIPLGRLNGAALWPGVSVYEIEEKLESFLDEGYTEAEPVATELQDTFAKSWGEYRAFDEVYLRELALPSTVETSDQGSASFLLTQIEWMGAEAQKARAVCDAMLAVASAPPPEAPITHMSANVPTSFRW